MLDITGVPPNLKTCVACAVAKDRGEFSPRRQARDGLYSYCRPCAAAKTRSANSDPERRARKAAYQRERRSNPETAARDRQTSLRWKASNPERAQAHSRTPEKLAANAAWNARHPEQRSAYARAYRARNPEVSKVSQQRRRARKAQTASTLAQSEWVQILEDFNYSCAYCLVAGVPLQQEHMTPLSRGGEHDRSNVVPSCASCNYRKHTRTLLEFLEIGGRS